jgi:hypothetical protein
MANELDKTIEELEAEVLDELEEANGADAPMKSAGKPEKGGKIEGDNTQDTGPAVVSPDTPAFTTVTFLPSAFKLVSN